MKTHEERLAADRERTKRWRERQQASGKKGLSVMLTIETHQFLTQIKDQTGKSYSQIVEEALVLLKETKNQ